MATAAAARHGEDGWRPGAVIGVFLFGGYLLQTMGLRLTTPPKSAFLTGLATVMVPLLGALVYRIKPQISEVAGVLVATVGHGTDDTGRSTRYHQPRRPADVWRGNCIFGAHRDTGSFCRADRLRSVESSHRLPRRRCRLYSLFWWVETPRIQWQPLVVWAILITGLLCTALAFTIQAWAQHYTTSTRTALIYALEPVFAWITSFLLVGEGLSGRAAAGAVLILSGVCWWK